MVAILFSTIFPVSIHLSGVANATAAPTGIAEVMSEMIKTIFTNPIVLLSQGQYLGILFWSIVFGIALKVVASDTTKDVITDIANAVTKVVGGIIQCAPIGIMGLVFKSVSESGLAIFTQYGQLILLLVGCIAFVAFVTAPLISAVAIRRNPYPLVLTCLRESGLTAFFKKFGGKYSSQHASV